MYKRTLVFLVGMFFLIHSLFGGVSVSLADGKPQISSSRAIVIDMYDGNVIYEKNSDEKALPASITKVLTAIIASEKMKKNEKITISKEVSKVEPSNSQVLLEEGEKITKEDALAMMMMVSSNDVAHAVAEHISGGDDEFSNLMNKKAEKLGAKDSSFKNPSGLPNEEHLTTAYDMSLIIREVKKHPEVIEAMKRKEYKLKTNKREVEIEKTHSIYEENKYAVGGKTGWTNSSGNTLVVYSKEGDKEVATVVMGAAGSGYAYEDTNKLVEYGFSKIDPKTFFKKDEIVTTLNDGEKKIPLYAKEDITVTQKGRVKIQNRISLKDIVNYNKSDTIGNLIIVDENNVVEAEFPLYSDKDIKSVKKMDADFSVVKIFGDQFKETKVLNKIWKMIILPAIILFSVIVIIGRIFGGRRKSKKERWSLHQ